MKLIETFSRNRGAFLVSAAVNCGSVLFGFDTGVVGGISAMASFQSDFALSTDKAKLADASSNIIALLNAGAFFGAIIPPALSRWIGRRKLLAIAGLFFLIGGTLQTAANAPNLGMLYAGRVLAGLGVGMISNVSPVFVAECSPKELRGFMMAAFELFLVSGGVLAYWTAYGCSVNMAATSAQWRTPLSLQIVLASFVIFTSYFCCESPRWLAKQGKWDQCQEALLFLRTSCSGPQDPALIAEMAEIKAQIEEELAVTKGRTVKELFSKKNFPRLVWGLSVAVFAMWGGHNAILYYGPQIFGQLGLIGQNSSILASGIFTIIKWVMTIVFMVAGIQIFKRKTMLMVGAFFMGSFLFALGAVLATHPPITGAPLSSSGQGMMALIYLFVIAYSLSWGPLQWIYMGEIFPTRIRDYGMAACAMMIWLMNYIVSKIAPIAILNIGWKTWMIFGTTNVAACVFAYFLPETKDLSLEEMDILFGVVDSDVRRHDIEANLGEKGSASTSTSQEVKGVNNDRQANLNLSA